MNNKSEVDLGRDLPGSSYEEDTAAACVPHGCDQRGRVSDPLLHPLAWVHPVGSPDLS